MPAAILAPGLRQADFDTAVADYCSAIGEASAVTDPAEMVCYEEHLLPEGADHHQAAAAKPIRARAFCVRPQY